MSKAYRVQLGSKEHSDPDQIITAEVISELVQLAGFYLVREVGTGRLFKIHQTQLLPAAKGS